nr:hypothetical protein [Prolixibacteraceae bacterium]
FYKTINLEKFKNIDEVKEFASQNKDYIELVHKNGVYTLETRFYNNPARYFLNSDKIFQIENNVYKLFDSGSISTKIENINKLKEINNDNYEAFKNDSDLIYSENKNLNLKSVSSACGTEMTDDVKQQVGDYWYMTRLSIECGEEYRPGNKDVYFKCKATSYKRGFLWIYYYYVSDISVNINTFLSYNSDSGSNLYNYRTSWVSHGVSSTEGKYSINASTYESFETNVSFNSYYCTANNLKTIDEILSCN